MAEYSLCYDADVTPEFGSRMDEKIGDILRGLRKEEYEQRRATAINAARTTGWTWERIAEALNMTLAGVQRAPGVDSPWNRARHPEWFDGI